MISKLVQEDDDPASTARVPIVLAGLNCTGMEQSISGCSDFRLGRGRTNCRHDIDVHLVCSSGPNPGTPSRCGAACTILSKPHTWCAAPLRSWRHQRACTTRVALHLISIFPETISRYAVPHLSERAMWLHSLQRRCACGESATIVSLLRGHFLIDNPSGRVSELDSVLNTC